MRRPLSIILAVAGSLALTTVASAEGLQGSLQIKGSDTMVNLCQAWAEAFMAKHPQVTVAVTGGGSGTGIAALIGGSCDLAAASRTMTPKEQAELPPRSGRSDWMGWPSSCIRRIRSSS